MGTFQVSTAVQIKGTHYNTAGNATKVQCDTNKGDFILVATGGGDPEVFDTQLGAGPSNPGCLLLQNLRNIFASFGPYGVARQIVSNGKPKSQCVFHGYLNSGANFLDHWVAQTVRTFDSAGQARTEKGSFTLSLETGEIFIGKVKVKY